MAKKRASANRRKKRKVMSLNQAVHRKRSQKRSHHPYRPHALEPGSSTSSEAWEPQRHNTGEDLAGLANQFAKTLETYARGFRTFLPPSGAQQDSAPPRTLLPLSVMGNGLQVINRELLNHFMEQVHRMFQAMTALTRSRSPQDFFRVQSDLAKRNLDSVLEAASRILVVVVQMTTEAIRLNQLGRSRL